MKTPFSWPIDNLRVSIIALTILSCAASAQQEVRTWTSADGGFSTAAKLVRLDGDLAVLQKVPGDVVIRVPINKLSAKDKEFLKELSIPAKPPAGNRTALPHSGGSKHIQQWIIDSSGVRFLDNSLLSNDASLLACVSDTEVMVWNTLTGQVHFKCPRGFRKPYVDLAISRDNRYLADISHGANVRVWDLTTGKCTHELPVHTSKSAAFSPDGTDLIVSGIQEMHSRKVSDGSRTFKVASPDGVSGFEQIQYLGNSQRLLCLNGNRDLKVWDVVTQTVVGSMTSKDLPSPVTNYWNKSLWPSPDGKTVAIHTNPKDGALYVVDLESKKVLGKYPYSDLSPQRVAAFSPGGKYLVGMNTLKPRKPVILDAKTCAVVYNDLPEADNNMYFRDMRVSTDGKLIVASATHLSKPAVVLWKFPDIPGRVAPDPGLPATPSPEPADPTTTEASFDRTALQDPRGNRESLHKDESSEAWIYGRKDTKYKRQHLLSKDGKLMAAASDSKIFVWNTEDGTVHFKADRSGNYPILNQALSDDGKYLADYSESSNVTVWNMDTGKLAHEFPIYAFQAAFSPDSRLIVGSNLSLIARRMDNGELEFEYRKPPVEGMFGQVTFDATGKRLFLLTTSGLGKFITWDIASKSVVGTIERHDLPEDDRHPWSPPIQVSPNQKRLAVVMKGIRGQQGVRLVDLESHRLMGRYIFGMGHDQNIASFSPDGKFLILLHQNGRDGPIILDGHTCAELKRLPGVEVSKYTEVKVSADGSRIIASAIEDSRPAVVSWEFPPLN